MAGEMFLSKPFLKETEINSLFCLKSLGPVQIVAQCSDRRKGPIGLDGLSRVGARDGITTAATLSGPSLVS